MVQAFHVNVVSSLFRFAEEFLITRFYSQGSHELLSLAGQASAYWKDGKFGSIMFLLWYASLSNIISTISSLSCKKVHLYVHVFVSIKFIHVGLYLNIKRCCSQEHMPLLKNITPIKYVKIVYGELINYLPMFMNCPICKYVVHLPYYDLMH